MHPLLFALAIIAADPQPLKTVALPGHNFTLPQGFDVELVAGPPLVDRPIHADFDERGRLYVCESSGTNDRPEKQLADKPHWILRLEDTDGDGKFDRRTKFADKLMFPEGMLWLDGSIYVGAPPSIWKLTDTDDDGVADRREEWFDGKTLTGCANDLHGPYAGPDGWIYWCKGAFAQQTYDRAGKAQFVTKAAHIFRSRRDGTGIEPVMTGGMDNPVEVAFTPGGERIFTTTFFQHPGGGKRDGLVHAIYGGVYGKQHAVIDEHPRTGDLMPVLTHLGAAAPAGLARYESSVFGTDYRDNLFAALFNMHKVTRHVLTADGSTFASRDEDFLVSDNFDFHPTDVLEDADGSLVVIDTGGWYKLCCPTSQLWKPDVLGGIYRVRRSGVARAADPRGLMLKWDALNADALANLFGDDRPAVRRRVTDRLASLGTAAVEALQRTVAKSPSAQARVNAVWSLSRIDGSASGAAIRTALDDADETVRQVALHAVSVRRDRAALAALLDILAKSNSAANRRAAAEALGRLGEPAAVPALLSAAGEESDRPLEHSITYALLEIASPGEAARGLSRANGRTKRAALLALDQMDGGRLEPAMVAGLLSASDARIRETATWIVSRHANWGAELLPFLEHRLTEALTEQDAEMFVQLLARFANDPAIQSLMASRLGAQTETGNVRQRVILQGMLRSGLKAMPADWVTPIVRVFKLKSNEALVPLAVSVMRALPKIPDAQAEEMAEALFAVAANEHVPASVRLEALGVVPGGLKTVQPAVFEFVRASLSPEAPVSVRLSAADAVSKANLDEGQLALLIPAVRTAGPLEIERVTAPFARGSSVSVGSSLVSALAGSKALVNLRAETIGKLFESYPPVVREQAQELYRLQAAGTEQQKSKIESILSAAEKGDIRRGQAVFNSQKAACSTCHAIGYLGGNIGPDLSAIGRIRNERDLLESIVFPSASFVRSYEPVVVTMKSGRTHSGTIRQDAAAEVVLAINAKETVRIPREEIEELAAGTVSIMPAGLDQQLTPQELVDLITFLRAGR